jgi:hypothetical protein
MFKPLRFSTMAFAALGPVLLLGCAAQEPTAEAASKNLTPTPAPTLSLDTPVETIAADPRGKAILNHDVPGLLASPSYSMFENMNLSQIAAVSGGRITKAELDMVQANLSQISSTGETGQ